MRVLAVSGSLQRRSANAALLRALAHEPPESAQFEIYAGLGTLPHFNVDLDGDEPPAEVVDWRRHLAAADSVLIATPEYAHGAPGALKNALDWVVGSGELASKPVALVSASTVTTGGVRATMSLTTTLLAMAANVVVAINVPGVRGKLDARGELADERTLRLLREALVALIEVRGDSAVS